MTLTFGNWLMVIVLVAAIAVSGWFLLAAVALLLAELVYDVYRQRFAEYSEEFNPHPKEK